MSNTVKTKLTRISKKKSSLKRISKPPTEYHPWRLCPAGQHWVKEHSLKVPVSKKNPEGITSRREHCHSNPSHRDQLYPDEIHEIAKRHFDDLEGAPTPNNLKNDNGNDYDRLIRGWTKYWNDILKPSVLLDANLIKALIASESSFNPNIDNGLKGMNKALGLMQVTNSTRKILADEKGELKDRLVNITDKDAINPNLNICAGIRWLFQKRKLASIRLKREATWEEAVAEYKSYIKDLITYRKLKPGEKLTKEQKSAKEQIEKFENLYRALRK